MSDRPTATTNRRTVLKTAGTVALAGLASSASAIAQTDLPVEIEQNAEEEYVLLRNIGGEEVDLTGYSLNFDAEDGNDQIRQLAGDVVIGPGEEVTVATGDETTIETDFELANPYDGFVLDNDGTDVVSLVDPDGNVVVSTDGSGGSDPGGGGNEPERTLTVTVVDEDGDPVEGASVSVVTSDGEEIAGGETDSDGTVTFDVESGEYDVIVNHDDVTGPAATPATVDDADAEVSVTLDTSDDTATGIVRVVDRNGDPVEDEPVTLWPPGTVEEEATETRETNADGEVVIELLAGEPEDVVMYEVVVRDQSKRLGIMSDEHAGVQEVVFEVDTSDDDGDDSTDDGDDDSDDEGDQEEQPDGDDGDGDDGSDGDGEDMDEKSGDDKDVTDADGDGVAATDDADDDCPKGS